MWFKYSDFLPFTPLRAGVNLKSPCCPHHEAGSSLVTGVLGPGMSLRDPLFGFLSQGHMK